jgi:hypothetical protein
MLKEILEYILIKKNWWLIPTVLAFTVAGLLIVLGTSSPVSPFIYMLF